jgi:hypothetical protein
MAFEPLTAEQALVIAFLNVNPKSSKVVEIGDCYILRSKFHSYGSIRKKTFDFLSVAGVIRFGGSLNDEKYYYLNPEYKIITK